MRLSVVVPAHNEEATISQTLAHTRAQVQAHELLVANVCSTDRTGEIASRFAKVVTLDCSRGAALNRVAALASGDVLLFLHADTLLPPWYDVDTAEDLERLVEELRTHPSRAPHTCRFLERNGRR